LIRDSKFLYITTFIADDQLVLGNNQDLLYIYLEDKNGIATRLNIEPGSRKALLANGNKSLLESKDIAVENKVNSEGQLSFTIQIPISKIMKPDQSIRFNIGYRDQDNRPDKENSTLFWKPVWGTETDYKNSGSFILK
jgi:hypothetical protein